VASTSTTAVAGVCAGETEDVAVGTGDDSETSLAGSSGRSCEQATRTRAATSETARIRLRRSGISRPSEERGYALQARQAA
jgi:hypothetical protein